MAHRGTYRPPIEPDDVDSLNTSTKVGLVPAINEVLANQQNDAALIAKTVKIVHVDLGLVGPVVVPALPAGAKIIGVRVHVATVYPVSTVITVGDHSGGAGALVATAISDGTGITATALGDYEAKVYKTPVGDLSVAASGGSGATGASTVMIEYIDA